MVAINPPADRSGRGQRCRSYCRQSYRRFSYWRYSFSPGTNVAAGERGVSIQTTLPSKRNRLTLSIHQAEKAQPVDGFTLARKHNGTQMADTALITGASSGIGKELARIHASKGDDLLVVARREEALVALKQNLESEFGVSVKYIVADLTEPAVPQQIQERIESDGIAIDYLINNAGFGGHGKFHQRDWELDRDMIQLNVTALTDLTRRILPGMVERKGGKILNVASTAAFLPGPLQAVYYATKSYVLSFSQAIAEEVREENITVTALCPGPVATEFTSVGDLEGVAAFKNAATPASVAQVGYQAMMKGKLVAINDWKLSLMLNWLVPFLPRRTVLKLSRQSMEKSS